MAASMSPEIKERMVRSLTKKHVRGAVPEGDHFGAVASYRYAESSRQTEIGQLYFSVL